MQLEMQLELKYFKTSITVTLPRFEAVHNYVNERQKKCNEIK